MKTVLSELEQKLGKMIFWSVKSHPKARRNLLRKSDFYVRFLRKRRAMLRIHRSEWNMASVDASSGSRFFLVTSDIHWRRELLKKSLLKSRRSEIFQSETNFLDDMVIKE